MKKPGITSKGLKTVEEVPFTDTRSIISEQELMRQLDEKKGYTLYLGVFTKEEVFKILERSHLWHELTLKGFSNPLLDINTDDPHRHTLRVYFDTMDKAHLLVEIVLSDRIFKPRIRHLPSFDYSTYNMLVIEWLVLQNPLSQFGPGRPQLPDQQYPGLGIARLVSDMLVKVATHLKKDGILNFPQYYHNAVIYSEIFKFYDPYMHGTLMALKASLSKYSLAQASFAVSLGCVKNLRDGDYFTWRTEELILPLSPNLQQYFASREYENIIRNTMKEYSFDIDAALYQYRTTHPHRLPYA